MAFQVRALRSKYPSLDIEVSSYNPSQLSHNFSSQSQVSIHYSMITTHQVYTKLAPNYCFKETLILRLHFNGNRKFPHILCLDAFKNALECD